NLFILLLVPAPFKGSRYGVNRSLPVTDSELRLGRRAKQLKIPIVEIKQIRRGVDRTQRSVHVKFVAPARSRKTQRGYNLTHIAPVDVILHGPDQLLKRFIGHVGRFFAIERKAVFRKILILDKVLYFFQARRAVIPFQLMLENKQLVAEMVNGNDIPVDMVLQERDIPIGIRSAL